MGSSSEYGERIRRRRDAPLRPSGPRWQQYRRWLFRKWAAEGAGIVNCLYCGEEIRHVPGPNGGQWLGEVEHRISVERAPELAWKESNLAPVHGGGQKRSPSGLACNSIAASNSAVRDELGRPLPFTEEFKARKIAERQAWLERGGGRSGRPGLAKKPGKSPEKSPSPRQAKSPAATKPARARVRPPERAVDVQPDGRFRCDQPRMDRGKTPPGDYEIAGPGDVRFRPRESGCMQWHTHGAEGRCW